MKKLLLILGMMSFNFLIAQGLDENLVTVLDTIHFNDQKYRSVAQEIQEKYGSDSQEAEDNWRKKLYADSMNLVKVKDIIDTRGWLGSEIIGKKGNKTLFLVIQHADIKTQEKYLPILKKAVQEGNAKPQYFALLKDRVLLRQGEKQIYGSQLAMNYRTNEWELSPMIDPDYVDKRRHDMGLDSLHVYLRIWDLIFDVEEFKERMKVYDSKENKK
ncbi:MAG: hypothetical protein GQ527_12165 [Bacteroidales bacterium]|nr:hypothetical protein [Bacteroidales bacterium]